MVKEVLNLNAVYMDILSVRDGLNQSINQSINGGDGCRHQSASISVLHFTSIQINLITISILRSVSSSGKISCVIKNNILINPVFV